MSGQCALVSEHAFGYGHLLPDRSKRFAVRMAPRPCGCCRLALRGPLSPPDLPVAVAARGGGRSRRDCFVAGFRLRPRRSEDGCDRARRSPEVMRRGREGERLMCVQASLTDKRPSCFVGCSRTCGAITSRYSHCSSPWAAPRTPPSLSRATAHARRGDREPGEPWSRGGRTVGAARAVAAGAPIAIPVGRDAIASGLGGGQPSASGRRAIGEYQGGRRSAGAVLLCRRRGRSSCRYRCPTAPRAAGSPRVPRGGQSKSGLDCAASHDGAAVVTLWSFPHWQRRLKHNRIRSSVCLLLYARSSVATAIS